jgi:hydroxypyruvate isomerase
MPNFAANLSMMYVEVPFLERFELAAKDGFKAVEYLFPYAYDPVELAARLKNNGLQQVLMNAPPGGFDDQSIQAAWAQGVRGIGALREHQKDFRGGFELALRYADALECPRIHVMAGLVPEHLRASSALPVNLQTSSEAVHKLVEMRSTYLENLRLACGLAESAGREVLIEPINTRDIPNYFLNKQCDAHNIVVELGCPNLRVQMDLFHAQIVEGDLDNLIKAYLPTGRVGHFQIAGVPKRHEPHVGEINYPYLFDLIDELAAQTGWTGWIGCEYHPLEGAKIGGTSKGLKWLRDYRSKTL